MRPTRLPFPDRPPTDQLAHLHRLFVARADAGGVLDIAVATVDSPIGDLLVAVTDLGLVRVAFGTEGHDAVLTELASQISPRILRRSGRTDPLARQLDEYFAGRRRHFEVPLDLRLAHGFRRRIVELLPAVGYGTTVSYGELAATAGSPAAVRAVGTACATNPVPVVVPCHRVVRSGGGIGQYRGGTAAKQALLDLEAATLGGVIR